MKYSYGILCSGELGLTCLKEITASQKVNFVFTDYKSASIREYCVGNEIPLFVGNPRNHSASEFLKGFNTDVVLSINYLFIIEEDIIRQAHKFALNIHGSLLPKYRGRTPHVWAIINNEQETGITVHRISAGCDEGDIAYQEIVPIGPDTTGAELLLVFRQRYPIIIKEVIHRIETDNLEFKLQDHTRATWFGKRQADDGLINWNWQKERIKNWVRAQAKPYPGAFTYLHANKIIIHRIEFSEFGFSDSHENGRIMNVINNNIVVKTPNGAVTVIDYEMDPNQQINIGDILG